MSNVVPSAANLDAVPGENIRTVIIRSAGYALSSFLALYSFVWKSPTTDLRLSLLFLCAFSLTLPFFFAYSVSFPSRGKETRHEHNHDFWHFLLGGIVICLVTLYFYPKTPPYPPPPLCLALAFYSLSVLGYGAFLNFYYSPTKHSPVRYQIIWPILLSIALPFFIARSIPLFLDNSQLWTPIIPLGVFFAFAAVATVVFSGKFASVPQSPSGGQMDASGSATPNSLLRESSRGFILLSLVVLGGATAVAIAFPSPPQFPLLGEVLSSFLFAVMVSAYVSVFECWSVTAGYAIAERNKGEMTLRYYYATMAALGISIFLISLLLPFTKYGTILLLLFFLHSLIAVTIWYNALDYFDFLMHPAWWVIKVLMGGSVFLILGIGALVDTVRPTPLFIEPVTVTVFITIFNIMGFVKNADLPPSLGRTATMEWYASDKTRLLKHIFVLNIIGMGLSFGLYRFYDHPASPLRSLSDHMGNSFQLHLCYAVMILISLVFSQLPSSTPPLRSPLAKILRAAEKLLKISVMVRFVASCSVGVSIIVALTHHSRSIRDSITVAMPFVLSCMGGFVLNDYCDVEKDRINRPYRPIASGAVSSHVALMVSCGFLFVALIWALLVADNTIETLLYIGAIIGIVAYNIVVRRVPVVKTLYH